MYSTYVILQYDVLCMQVGLSYILHGALYYNILYMYLLFILTSSRPFNRRG